MKGLKVYQDIFMDSELLRLAEYINELRLAGRRGELSGKLIEEHLFLSLSLYDINKTLVGYSMDIAFA